MKKLLAVLLFISGAIFVSSCTKSVDAIETLKKSCLYNDKIDYFKRWSNTFTKIDTYTAGGQIQQSDEIYPIGYFKLNSDMTYNVFSDGVPQVGTWDLNSNCQLVLDSNKSNQRNFDVVSLTPDSLTIRRKSGNTVYTQHYRTFTCPNFAGLEAQWDNTVTYYEHYLDDRITYTEADNPLGYFRLNTDMTYNVLSNGVPQDGPWNIDPQSCKLVLDNGMPSQRAFDIQKLTTDSLAIWRKDTVKKINYLQYYIKHK